MIAKFSKGCISWMKLYQEDRVHAPLLSCFDISGHIPLKSTLDNKNKKRQRGNQAQELGGLLSPDRLQADTAIVIGYYREYSSRRFVAAKRQRYSAEKSWLESLSTFYIEKKNGFFRKS